MKKKGFTLVELLAVIVIMAILALIAIPITIKIISDSRENANKQSILNYAKAVEQDVVNWKAEDTSRQLTDYKELYEKGDRDNDIKVSGNKVSCDEIDIDKEMNLTLYSCYLVKYGKEKSKKYDYIDGKVVESDSEESLVLNYAKNIEEDIPKWKQETSNDDYTQYDFNRIKDDKITCEEKSVSSEGKLTLNKCYLKDSKEDKRTYYSYKNGKVEKEKSSGGNDSSDSSSQDDSANKIVYSIGQEITVAGEQYYVISDSPAGQDYVTALKANPLTTTEINTYGAGHVNMYIANPNNSYCQTAYDYDDDNHTGGMAYYSSTSCGQSDPTDYSTWTDSGCTTDYASSEVRYVIDKWAQAKFTNGELKAVDGYGARLATKEELQPIAWSSCTSPYSCPKENNTPSWIYNSNYYYYYWTMSQWNNSSSNVWLVNTDGSLNSDGYGVYNVSGVVRPVLNIYKSKI